MQWTAVAHEHRRPALGTLILEPDAASVQATHVITKHRAAVLDKLVDVADHYGFDGWFINVEGGKWKNGDPATFVGELRDKMRARLGNRSQVIAYPYGPGDKVMFSSADGVFVNYNWPTDDASMQGIVKAAGDRSADVYMGMDGFGGFRGNTQPDPEHVEACAKHDLSIALFGPGVTLEKAANRTFSLLGVDYDRRYWSSIGKHFGRHRYRDPGPADSMAEWPVPWEIPTPSLAQAQSEGSAAQLGRRDATMDVGGSAMAVRKHGSRGQRQRRWRHRS